MNFLILDTETTGAINDTKGNPFTQSNRLCYVGLCTGGNYRDFNIEYGDGPFGGALDTINSIISSSDLIVGFNLKFDLHWLRRYGITSFQDKKIWDCQNFEFIKSKQKEPFPSLDISLVKRGLPPKLDIVRTEYWEKGIDTDCVPEKILREYLQTDVEGTFKLYLCQMEEAQALPMATQRLISLVNQDTLTLQEMEWNGLPFDINESLEKAVELGVQITNLDKTLSNITGLNFVNFNSGDHLSCILYGGTIKEEYKEIYKFYYKDGRIKDKERWAIREHVMPTLVDPLPKTGLKKVGFYKTDEGTLRKLKGNAKVTKLIKLLLERAKLEKLKSTYYEGFPKLHTEMEWEPNILHGQQVQCIAATGRLAGSKPNQHNLPDPIRGLVKSRYI